MEPWKAKVVAALPAVGREEREALLAAAGYNPSLLPADKVAIDLLSDSGAGALSDRQLAELMTGDEAYAGSRDFGKLEGAVRDLFGLPHVVPAHQGRGAENLLCRALLRSGDLVASNAPFETTVAHIEHRGARTLDVTAQEPPGHFAGDLDLQGLAAARPALVIVGMTCNALGGRPVSLGSVLEVGAWCRREAVPLAIDASRIFENAAFSAEAGGGRVRDILREIAGVADVIYMSGKKDALNKIGGFAAVRDPALYRRLVDLCLVFEGMPSYGGMSGRDMAALAQGLREAADERHLAARLAEIRHMADRLRAAGVPFLDPPGGHCIVLDAAAFLPGIAHPACSLAAALYAIGGVRGAALAGGLFHGGGPADRLRLAIPRRVFTPDQLAFACEVVIEAWRERDRMRVLEIAQARSGRTRYATRFRPASRQEGAPTVDPSDLRRTSLISPFRRIVVEHCPEVGPGMRRNALERAGWNTFSLAADAVAIDLFTDSGTAAMSAAQWSRQWVADDALIGSCSLARFREAVRATYGFPHSVAAHQGRGAEAVLFDVLAGPGKAVCTNMQFFSTAQHIARVGAELVDVIRDEAYDLALDTPFKGDVDLERLRTALATRDVALVAMSLTVNDAGGQPMSRRGLAAVARLCRDHRTPLWLDATRLAENAWFVREAERSEVPLADVVRDLAGLADGVWVSAKKDCLANIGGFLAFRDEALLGPLLEASILYEGMPGSGGLAGRDLEFVAVGMGEMVDEAYMAHRIGQIRRLWLRLRDAGLPVLAPPGGHAVLVDAQAFLAHLPPDQSPGHALAGALVLDGGVRAMPVATALHAGGSRQAGRPREMLRLTVPRRVYSDAQLALAADALIGLYARRETITGLRRVEQAGDFPFITGRFAPIVPAGVS